MGVLYEQYDPEGSYITLLIVSLQEVKNVTLSLESVV